MTTSQPPDSTVAGYRLVRRLGSGSRADVYLGVGTTGTVALKVFASETSRESIGSELDALGRLESPHLVRLLDISGSSNERPILVLERVGPGSAAAWIASRNAIECGEAVTLLAPIAALVGELHSVGVAHAKIAASAIHFGSHGEPILLGLGHCELFAAGGSMAAIDTEPAAARDRDALAAMTLGVLSHVRDSSSAQRVSHLAQWIESTARAYEFAGELAERLFSCAEPLPIAISRETAPSEIPGRATAPSLVDTPEQALPQPRDAPQRVPDWIPAVFLDNPIGALKKRALEIAHGVRPRFWVAAASVLVGLFLAMALIPSGAAPRAAPAVSAPTPAPGTPLATTTPLPDDPLLASKLLLEERSSCFRELSILCLDGVDEPSSAAFTSDSGLIQQAQAGSELPKAFSTDYAGLTLIERFGDTALIGLGANGSPPTILVIRNRTGWRIRDYLSGAQAIPAA